LEVHRQPDTRAGAYEFKDVRIVSSNDSVAPLAMPTSAIAVADLLP
jgi:hypothetical protein